MTSLSQNRCDGDHNLGDLGSGAGAIWWVPTPRGIVGERGPYGLGMAVHDANPALAALHHARLHRRCSAAALLRSSRPQQRQLSEGLSPLGLVRLLLRKPRKHTCEVQRILPQQLKHLSTEASGSEAAISLSKDATSILTGGYRPVSP
jgi:hypothetical protein